MERKMKQKIEKGKRLFTHTVDSCRLKPGDLIYTYRGLGSYSHHGIYVGEGCVIHFIPTQVDGGSESSEQKPACACAKCGYQGNFKIGVVKSCLFCFLSHGAFSSDSLCVYQYEESKLVEKLKRAGTCTTSHCLQPETVVGIATKIHHENCFGHYDLFDNNCEDFATFCKTGIRRSEQVLSVMNKPIIPNLVNFIKNLAADALIRR